MQKLPFHVVSHRRLCEKYLYVKQYLVSLIWLYSRIYDRSRWTESKESEIAEVSFVHFAYVILY